MRTREPEHSTRGALAGPDERALPSEKTYPHRARTPGEMPSSHRPLAVLALVVLATVALVAPASVAGAAGAGAAEAEGAEGGAVGAASVGAGSVGAGPGTGDQLAQQVDADSVRMTVALQPDGDARWTVTYRVHLDSDNETEAFESLRRDVDANPENYTERFARRMRSTARTAENATGREMGVRNVTVAAYRQELGRTYGIVEYTFEWTGFAVVEGDAITAGDALAGLFLDEGTTLVFAWPEGYGPTDVRPSPDSEVGDDRSAGWAGPEDFGQDEPRVAVQEGAGGPDARDGGGPPLAVLLAGTLLGLVGLAGAATWYRRRDGSAAVADDEGGDSEPAPGTADDEPPEDLLSNEEKVMKLVGERGGRVKQQEIVEAFEWTEAKTSQVVRDLREQGDLEGFRLGRENVLRLPEEDDDGDA